MMTADVAIDTNTVYKIGGFRVDREIVRYIREASDISGVSFDYLLAKAGHESRFEANASAGSSSAEGLFQFTTDTWLQQMKFHGNKYGYAKLASKIYRDARGRYRVMTPQERDEILALRRSPRISALLAAEYAKSNKKILEEQLGRQVTSADLYLAHFMGPSGAVALLRADKFTPSKYAADLFPEAALANAPIFYQGQKMRTVRQVRQLIAEIFQDKIDRFAVLPKDLKIWLDKLPHKADRKKNIVVKAPVLKMDADVANNRPPFPSVESAARFGNVLPGEGVNLDDDELLNELRFKLVSAEYSSGRTDAVSADFIPSVRARYDVAGVTRSESEINAVKRPVYTARAVTYFETDEYQIRSPLPVMMSIRLQSASYSDDKKGL